MLFLNPLKNTVISFFLFIFLFSFGMERGEAYEMKPFRGHVKFGGLDPLSSEDVGFWLAYASAGKKKDHRHVKVEPIEIQTDGSFRIPKIDFGRGKFHVFYKGNLSSGWVSAAYDRHIPKEKRAILFAVPKRNLDKRFAQSARQAFLSVLEKEDLLNYGFTLQFYSRPGTADFPIYTWIDVKIDGCEGDRSQCGPGYFGNTLSNLLLVKTEVDFKGMDERAKRVLLEIQPDKPLLNLFFYMPTGRQAFLNHDMNEPTFLLTRDDIASFDVYASVKFRVAIQNLSNLIGLPENLEEYRVELFRQSGEGTEVREFEILPNFVQWPMQAIVEGLEPWAFDFEIMLQAELTDRYAETDVRSY